MHLGLVQSFLLVFQKVIQFLHEPSEFDGVLLICDPLAQLINDDLLVISHSAGVLTQSLRTLQGEISHLSRCVIPSWRVGSLLD